MYSFLNLLLTLLINSDINSKLRFGYVECKSDEQPLESRYMYISANLEKNITAASEIYL
jgi:hypothetical protein